MKITTANSSYKKLAVPWLNEALCFVLSSVLADSFRLPKSPTSCSCQTKNSVAGVTEFFVEVGKMGVKMANVLAIMDGGNKFAVEFEIETERFGYEEEIHLWTFNEAGKVIAFRHYLDTAKHIAANEKYKSISV